MTGDDVLSIDYWHSTVAAALLRPGDAPVVVAVDGASRAPSAVAVDPRGRVRVGLAATDYAVSHPQATVRIPAQRVSDGPFTLGGVEVDPIDLLAATLSAIAHEAKSMTATIPGQVVISVPTGWVGRQRRAIEAAATRAGLTRPTVVNAAESIVRHQLRRGAALPVGSVAVVVRLDSTVGELVILRRHRAGCEVLANFDLGEIGETPGATLPEQAAWALTQGLDAADADPTDVAGLFCQVPHELMQPLAYALRGAADLTVTPTQVADLAVAFGAGDASEAVDAPVTMAPQGGAMVRSVVAAAVAWLAAGVLIYQMFNSATAYRQPFGPGLGLHTEPYAWALAAIFATLGAASLVTILSPPPPTAHGPDPSLGSGLMLVAALGVGAAGALSLVAGQHFAADPQPLLTWTLVSTIPLAAVLILTGRVVTRTPPAHQPGRSVRASWREHLTFPLPALLLASVSIVVLVASFTNVPPVDSDWWWRMTHVSAFFMGWAVAFLLPGTPWRRTWAGAVLSIIATWATSYQTASVVCSCLTAAITSWWVWRLASAAPGLLRRARSAAGRP